MKKRLSFSVSREEAVVIANALSHYGIHAHDSTRGVILHFARKLERALARGDLLGKEG